MQESKHTSEVVRQLAARVSVRSFEPQPISQEARQMILKAAIQAPTAGNQVLYTILDIEDQELKEKLAELCDHQPFIARAPLVLIFLADCRKWHDCYRFAGAHPREPGTGDLLLAFADACIAAQNAVTAAWSLGIGSCYIGDILEHAETISSLLELDRWTMPAAMVVFGYPDRVARERRKPRRFELSHIVRTNRYQAPGPEEWRTMIAEISERGSTDFEGYVKAFCSRKYMSDFVREMNRSADVYLSHFSADERAAEDIAPSANL
ncbi:MAG: nitroreductase family protein [Rectinemataceae bacterium]|nr:nitroreductase family protein [Spirochaetaceae bacterium]